MRRLTLFALVVGAVSVLAATTLSAQQEPVRIVFVDSQAAINAHPAGQAANQLQEQARQEIGNLRNDINAIAQKIQMGQTLSADESERYPVLLTTLDQVQKRYNEDIQAAAQPAIDAVNSTIRDIAVENGYTIVFDRSVAAQGLVVYAEDGLDITPLVLERLKATQ